jgi:hypothetical protein
MRKAWGLLMLTCRCWLDSIAWPRKKAMNVDTMDTMPTTMVNTDSFAHNTGRRFGTAVRAARIMPVAYSPLINSTPSTPTASWEMWTPLKLATTALKLARSSAEAGGSARP